MISLNGVATRWWHQVPRKRVLRWQGHVACSIGGWREQSNDDHRRELLVLLGAVLAELGLSNHYDVELLYRAVWHHDDGEDILGNDVLYALKAGTRDFEEYCAFADTVQPLVGGCEWLALHRAFLLQFVHKHHGLEAFPAEALREIEYLARARSDDAVLFTFLERIDYLLYALEQLEERDNPHFVREVFPNQSKPLDDLVELFPQLDLFWRGSGLRDRCANIVEQLGILVQGRAQEEAVPHRAPAQKIERILINDGW